MNIKILAALSVFGFAVAADAQVAPGQLPFAPNALTTGDCVKALNAFQGTDAGAPCGAGTVPSGTANSLAYWAVTGNTLAALPTANNAVLVTNGSGVPSESTTLPSGLSATNLSLVTPILGTPQSGTLTNTTGLPISTGLTGAGTGVLAALGINVGTAGSFVVNGGALGTPSSGTLTSVTGLPISTGLTGAGTGVLTALGVNVGTSGAFVVNGGALGTPSSGTLTNATGLPISSGVSGLGTGVATALGNALNGSGGVAPVGFPIFTGAVTLPDASTITSSGHSAIGVGRAAANSNIQSQKDSTYNSELTSAFIARNNTSSTKMVVTGYDGTADLGYIQSLNSGTGYKILAVQPNGNSLLIGTVTNHSSEQLQVNGTSYLNGNITSGASSTISSVSGTLAVTSGGGTTLTLGDTAPAMPNLASSAAALDALCWNATGGVITHNGAGALCSASLRSIKDFDGSIDGATALAEILALQPMWARYNVAQTGVSDHSWRPMLVAEDVEKVDVRLATYSDGQLRGVSYQFLPVLNTAAIQGEHAHIKALEERLADLEAQIADLKASVQSH